MDPPTDPNLPFSDHLSRVEAVYIHDDRLGPYARADLEAFTIEKNKVATALNIKWPGGQASAELSLLEAMIVPVPTKIRLTVERMHIFGRWTTTILKTVCVLPQVELQYGYRSSRNYLEEAHGFGLSEKGLYELCCETTLSRYIGYIRLMLGSKIAVDILLDTTETAPNPMVLGIVGHAAWPKSYAKILKDFAGLLDTPHCIL